ncbi:MAG: hypothetical protein A2046_04330 [Bacteroidetes bacterium GWA2_30_7]|nr:MAG: hypothetical protein A2046_04330 [Bacteroidetes bacterium GWA2_30_7]
MKNLFLFLVVIVIFQISCTKESAKPVVLAEKVTYSVFADNNDGNLPILSQFYDSDFGSKILENIKTNKTQATDFAKASLKIETINEIILSLQSQFSKKETNEFFNELIFNETWLYDSSTMKIEKKVKDLSFFYQCYLPEDSLHLDLKNRFLFKINLNDSVKAEKSETISIKAEYVVKLSACDSLFTKLVGFDTKPFVKSLINKALKKEITPYDYFSEEPKMIVENDILLSLGATTDTVEVENVETGEPEIKVVKNEIVYEEITELIFIEKWTFDYQKNIFSKEIIGYGPVREYFKPYMDDMKVKSVPFILRFDIPKKNS